MYIVIPGLSNNRAIPSGINRGNGTHFIKREIEVGRTASTIIVMVYLGLWLAGVGLCVFYCVGRSRRVSLRTIFVWKGEKGKGKRPEGFKSDKDRPTSRQNSKNGTGTEVGPSAHGRALSKAYADADPWRGGFERIHAKPWKGKNKSSGVRQDHIAAGPSGQHVSLSRIDEESMSNRMSSGGSRVISRDNASYAKPLTRSTNATDLTVEVIGINAASNHFPASPRSPDRSSNFPPPSRNLINEAYGLPVHQVASAATSSASLTVDSPLTEESGISRQLITPSLDEFPLPQPPMWNIQRELSPPSFHTPQSANFTATTTNITAVPNYHMNNTRTITDRHSHGGTDPSVSTLPLYSSRRVSSQTRVSGLSNVTTSDTSVGTEVSQPVVVTVQQARRVSAHAIPVSDLNHFEVGRAV